MMHRFLSSTLLGLCAVLLAACGGTAPQGPVDAPRPRVLVPFELNDQERRLLPEVEDALRQAGYRPTRRGPAEYNLVFSIEHGPVNADTYLKLMQQDSVIADAYARVGGPRIIVQRQQVIQESFQKALQSFMRQLSADQPYLPGYPSAPYPHDPYSLY